MAGSDAIDIVRGCQRIARELRSRIAKLPAVRMDRQDVKDAVRDMVDGYFRTDRPILLKDIRREERFGTLDQGFQNLLRLTHRRNPRDRYLDLLTSIQTAWESLEVVSIPEFGDMTGNANSSPTDVERRLLETLRDLCPAASICYTQALAELVDSGRSSWRGTACELRETLREVLDKLAPTELVETTPNFKLDPGAKGPTMKQKVRFILKTRKQPEAARTTVERAADLVEEKFGVLVRSIYERSSVSVHTGRAKEEVLSIKRFVETVLEELLEIRTPR